jgi:hypothetical protein
MGEDKSKKLVNKGKGIASKVAEEELLSITPDICKTPGPGGPVPIPYPSFANSSSTSSGSKKVKIGDKMASLKKSSSYEMSIGDEPGTNTDIFKNKEVLEKGYEKEKTGEINYVIKMLKVNKLGVPLWLWGIIGVTGLLIIWFLISNIPVLIEPYEPLE